MKNQHRLMLYKALNFLYNSLNYYVFLFNFNIIKFLSILKVDFLFKVKFLEFSLDYLNQKLDIILGIKKIEEKRIIKRKVKERKEIEGIKILFLPRLSKRVSFLIRISRKDLIRYRIELFERRDKKLLEKIINMINRIIKELDEIIKKIEKIRFSELAKDRKKEEKNLIFYKLVFLEEEGKIKIKNLGNDLLIEKWKSKNY